MTRTSVESGRENYKPVINIINVLVFECYLEYVLNILISPVSWKNPLLSCETKQKKICFYFYFSIIKAILSIERIGDLEPVNFYFSSFGSAKIHWLWASHLTLLSARILIWKLGRFSWMTFMKTFLDKKLRYSFCGLVIDASLHLLFSQ